MIGAISDLRLEVTPVTEPEAGGGFQVRIHIDGNEVTSAADGLGVDPYDLLIPTNRLIATGEPHLVQIARCTCGEYDCGGAEVTIARRGHRVYWRWVHVDGSFTFAAPAYDAEMARIADDHSWETPDRTAGRLVLTGLDREKLASQGFSVSWVAESYDDPGKFRVSLHRGMKQVFADFPWDGRTPEELARDICEAFQKPRRQWPRLDRP